MKRLRGQPKGAQAKPYRGFEHPLSGTSSGDARPARPATPYHHLLSLFSFSRCMSIQGLVIEVPTR